ncbi:hypothetical protein WJX84_006666 [Apatococcus fuscideae]|uniref:Rab-GAP TBC domain-containing protein n=1 Tax=Apatococcus fuscideae TaxID=2026836 RepID=A0AAW1SY50_9CHLO
MVWKVAERKNRVDKDVRRTDRSHSAFAAEASPNITALRNVLLTYGQYNFDLGYCQVGAQSPTLIPVLTAWWVPSQSPTLIPVLAEWVTVGERTLLDPPLHAHLASVDALNFFFAYRWLLIHFKREFAFDEVLRLWEALWAGQAGPHFHIYVCAAVLIQHRKDIVEGGLDFDGLLRFCIDLRGRIDLHQTLRDAEPPGWACRQSWAGHHCRWGPVPLPTHLLRTPGPGLLALHCTSQVPRDLQQEEEDRR